MTLADTGSEVPIDPPGDRGTGDPEPGEGAASARPVSLRRWAALGTVVLVLVVVGIVNGLVSPAPIPSAPPVVIAAAPAGSESSSWYCIGSTGTAGGAAHATVLVTNTTAHAEEASVVVTDDSITRTVPLRLPAFAETAVTPSQVVQGPWLAATVNVGGGGVVVTQVVQGPTGWSSSPCSSTTLERWYFASGATSAGSAMTIALFNPTATSAVIDTTFFTARGPIQPEPDEGIVVPPGQVVAIDVGTYVQDQNAVATVVSAQSGRIVASELWTYSSAGQQGMSLEVGAPALSSNWSIPLTQDVAPGPAGALTQLDVLNPRSSPERVDVTVRTPSGSLAPFVATVAPETTWHLRADQATRIPPGTDYAVSVRASGGAGVVVSRTMALPSTTTPQWGTTPAVAALPRGFGGLAGPNVDRTGPLGRHAVRWVLPAPATPAGVVVAGASPSALSVQNLSKRELDVQVSALVHGKVHSLGRLGRLRIGPGRFAYLDSARLNAVALDPLEVETSGLASVTEDLVPAAGYGVVTTAAVPLS